MIGFLDSSFSLLLIVGRWVLVAFGRRRLFVLLFSHDGCLFLLLGGS